MYRERKRHKIKLVNGDKVVTATGSTGPVKEVVKLGRRQEGEYIDESGRPRKVWALTATLRWRDTSKRGGDAEREEVRGLGEDGRPIGHCLLSERPGHPGNKVGAK